MKTLIDAFTTEIRYPPELRVPIHQWRAKVTLNLVASRIPCPGDRLPLKLSYTREVTRSSLV